MCIKKLLKEKEKLDFDIIISDLVPEAFLLAKILKIPSYGIARFTWDWFFYNSEIKKLKETKLIKDSFKCQIKFFSNFCKENFIQ